MRKRLITTGGTIDKIYIPTTGELAFSDTNLRRMIEQARINIDDLIIQELMRLDSLDMTDEHRDLIAQACMAASEEQIVITHGTDTMPETARRIKADLRHIGNKTIVLTGAMVPYSVRGSDALFNLGTAFAHVDTLAPGVYVSMNGRAFGAASVRKNKARGLFEYQ